MKTNASPFGLSLLVLLAPWVAACGDDGPNNNNNLPSCPEGHRAEGPACVPVFDDTEDCPGPSAMPALGGGCRSVGILLCATGFASDGEGGCEPVLPPGPDPCPPGTTERIGHTECQPVGVIQCAEGFVSDGEGGCDAILPPGPAPCPPGAIEQLGHDTCQPLGDCGPDPSGGGSPWGLIAVDGTTVYVDATADATGADGSASAPYPTVAQAIAAAPSGGQVAIAAGDYEEILVLSKALRLVGRCSELVTLRGRVQLGQPRPALQLTSGGSGSEVRGVTLTGPGRGLTANGAQLVTVEEVEVLDTGDYGVSLAASEATFTRVKVAGGTTVGVLSEDSVLRLEHNVIRDTLSEPGTGYFGRGINARCFNPSACGSLTVEASLVTGNRDVGIFITGVEADVVSSVVRDTQESIGGQAGSRGIQAGCSDAVELCGDLRVDGSLVTGNRDVGILAAGVALRMTSSVVRDTLPQSGDDTSGVGLIARCHETMGFCASLRVEQSLVAGNRDTGVFAAGSDVTILSSIVRETLPQESDQVGGRGINVCCDQEFGVCGTLSVEGSLVLGNSEVGISTFGVDGSVVQSVVRDTVSQGFDRTGGRGINSQCNTVLGVCGSLLVEESLILHNREMGIFATGIDTSVISSVVRDTLPRERDGAGGRGINAQCEPDLGVCGSLSVEGSLVEGNRDVGVFTENVDTTVVSSVVRDTLSQESDQTCGRGIVAQQNPLLSTRASVRVEQSLLSGNREIGIFAAGMDSAVVSSIVRDTLPQSTDLKGGAGIVAQCVPDTGACGILLVEGSLLERNRYLGVFTGGTEATVASSVIRNTLPRASHQDYGRGISAQCDERVGACGRVTVTDTLVTRSEDVGIYLAGVRAELEGVAVIDTRANTGGPWQGKDGQGIWALCDDVAGFCGSLSMTSCLVSSSLGAGVALEGTSGFAVGSLVKTVAAQPAEDKYGYGIQIGGREGEPMPTFHIGECVVRDAKLVGVLYFRSQGMLSSSVVSGAEYSVGMNEGSAVNIAKDNRLSGSVEGSPQWVSLFPTPAPPPATPLSPKDPVEE